MEKFDLKKVDKPCYTASAKECSIIPVPPMKYLMIDGTGNPNTSVEFKAAVDALYSVSYTLKFSVKKAIGTDYAVMPLEGLWYCEKLEDFLNEEKEKWQWTLLIRQPDFIDDAQCRFAIDEVKAKKGITTCERLRLEVYNEGLAAQVLHIGPFTTEGPTVERLHNFIKENGYEFKGRHHEIYLSDPRRCAPEKWKTIIRQPIAAK